MKTKILASISVLFLMVLSSVAVSASLSGDEVMAPNIAFNPPLPASVLVNQQFTLTAIATSTSPGMQIEIDKSTNGWSWTPLGAVETCTGTTCTITHQDTNTVTGTVWYKAIVAGASTGPQNVQVVPDTAAPTFSNMVESPVDPAIYAQGQVYVFTVDVTDNVGVDDVWLHFDGVDYLVANIDGSTYRVQLISDLAANVYDYQWVASDVNANWGYSGMQTYTVNRNDSTPVIDVDPDTTVPYKTVTTATCAVNNAEQTEQLFLDGSPVSNPHVTTLNAGDYTYTCAVAQTQNYTEDTTSASVDVEVTKINPVLSLTLDDGTGPVEGDISVEFGTQTTALGTVIEGDTGALTTFTRSDVGAVSNPNTATLPVNDYIYTFTYVGSANYNTLSRQATLSVTRIDPDLQCSVSPQSPITYSAATTVTCSINNMEQTVTILRNATQVMNNTEMYLGAGYYEFSASVPQSANYQADTWGSEPYTVDKAPATLIVTLDGQEADQTYLVPATYALGAEATTTYNPPFPFQQGTWTLYRNGIPSASGSMNTGGGSTEINMPVGDYVYRIELVADNYTAIPVERTAHVVLDPYAPQYYNEFVIPGSGVIFTTPQAYTFSIDWIDNIAVDDVEFTFGGVTYTYSGADIARVGDTFSMVLNDIPVGLYNYEWRARDAENNWNQTDALQYEVKDGTPPDIMITSPGLYSTNDTWLNATTDEIATCWFGPNTNPTVNQMDSIDQLQHSTFLTGLPLGQNTYYVRCTDQAGNEAETSVTWTVGVEQNVSVETGWNLISLSVIPFQSVLTSDAIWGTDYIIEHFNAQDQQWYIYDSNDIANANLTEVVPDQGYWIYSDTSRTITFLGTEPGQRTIQLYEGINMIGWTASESRRMDLALWFIQENVSWVQNQTEIPVKLLRDCDVSTEYFEPGKGYFINVTNDTTWVYPVNIPPVANAGIDKTVIVNENVIFDGSGSYDPDGSIVSYSWTISGVTYQGVTVTKQFGGQGTYVCVLTVTDNNGAISTDSVTISVNPSTPSGPNGGGGGGGGSNRLQGQGGFVQISLDAPESLTVTQGQTATFKATVTNIGQTDVYDITLSSVPNWIVSSPTIIATLPKGQSVEFDVTVQLPSGVLGSNYMTLIAKGKHPNATIEESVSMQIIGNPAECLNCTESTAWSACTNGNQTRTVYTCDEANNYQCVETLESRTCGGMTGYFLYLTDHPLVSGVVGLIVIGTIGGLFYGHKKGKIKIFKKLSGAFRKKAPEDKKPQGIDFKIEYKK